MLKPNHLHFIPQEYGTFGTSVDLLTTECLRESYRLFQKATLELRVGVSNEYPLEAPLPVTKKVANNGVIGFDLFLRGRELSSRLNGKLNHAIIS